MGDARTEPDVARLVGEYHQAVYRYAYRLTGSVHDAEDITQQTFLSAQHNIDKLRKIEHEKAWLFAILRNYFFRSRQRRRPALAADLEMKLEALPTPAPSDPADRDALQEALNRLPDAARLVLVMFYFEECSYREIAERLKMPIGTVMSRLARAKSYLRAELGEPDSPGPKRLAGVADK